MADDDDFAALLEASLDAGPPARRRLRRGERVRGTVVAIGEAYVFVDVGTKSEARVARHELEDDNGRLEVAVGDTVQGTVAEPEGGEGPLLVVHLRGALDRDALRLALDSATPVEGRVVASNRGGLEVEVGQVRAFCPASQIELGRAGELEGYVGQSFMFQVTEVRDGGRTVVLSRRALLEAERAQQAEQLARTLRVDDEREGIVDAIKPYGVFVDLGGLRGLIHVSRLGPGRVARPEDVVTVGETVRVRVLDLTPDPGGGPPRVDLALEGAAGREDAGLDEVVTATVTQVDGRGLKVQTPAGPGWVPLRELELAPGADPRRTYQVGQTLDVVAAGRDRQGRTRYSVTRVADVQAARDYRAFRAKSRGQKGLGSLGDLLRQVDLSASASRPQAPPDATTGRGTGEGGATRARAPRRGPPPRRRRK